MGIGNTIFLVPGLGGAAPPFVFDEDALAYITAVETADTEELELEVKKAINSFVKGCKNDGIWDAIKASCILAGARTLAGALVPLKGSAPTNVGGNFVSGDYDRKTGLVGDGSNKALTVNHSQTRNEGHLAVQISTASTINNSIYIGDQFGPNDTFQIFRSSTQLRLWFGGTASNEINIDSPNAIGLVGVSRPSSTNLSARVGGTTENQSRNTGINNPKGICGIFARSTSASTIDGYTNSRLSFYSIGDHIDLAKLDTRITNLINKFNDVI